MTDTRKDFEEWARLFMDKNERAPFSNEIWQACQSLNDKRIEQLLAVIELQRQAISLAKDTFVANKMDVRNVIEVLNYAIKPEDVELVEVGEADFDKPAGTVNLDIYNIDFDGMHKLYTIKTKGGNDANFG